MLDILKQYTDEDVSDGLALLDNWGLIHILFHGCPALWAWLAQQLEDARGRGFFAD